MSFVPCTKARRKVENTLSVILSSILDGDLNPNRTFNQRKSIVLNWTATIKNCYTFPSIFWLLTYSCSIKVSSVHVFNQIKLCRYTRILPVSTPFPDDYTGFFELDTTDNRWEWKRMKSFKSAALWCGSGAISISLHTVYIH